MAQDWQIPDDAICPDEPTCIYCGKICSTTEVVYTGDDDSYGGFECWCDDCQKDMFHKIMKDKEHKRIIPKQKIRSFDRIL